VRQVGKYHRAAVYVDGPRIWGVIGALEIGNAHPKYAGPKVRDVVQPDPQRLGQLSE